jgi:hypothetical protein
MKFHGLRDTCLSHIAVGGDAPQTIQWRAGHTTFAMTQRYIDAARRVAVGFGEPLPPLPPSLLVRSTERSKTAPNTAAAASTFAVSLAKDGATPTGIEAYARRRAIRREFGRIVDVAP